MKELEWLENNDAIAMLEYLKGKAVATPRKLCLFTCASLHRLLSGQPAIPGFIEVAGRFVEGPVTNEERRSAVASFDATHDLRSLSFNATQGLHSLSINLVRHCLTSSVEGYGTEMEWWHHATAAALCSRAEPDAALHDAALLRELFLTPLIRRIPRVPPGWRSNEGIIYRLAQTIYDERVFDRMPILGDALEEAGCTNADILNHCRQPGEHVRGCWAIDLLTGRK